MRRRIIASTAKWGLTGAAVVVGVVWAGSYVWCADCHSQDFSEFAGIGRGRFVLYCNYQQRVGVSKLLPHELTVYRLRGDERGLWPTVWLPTWDPVKLGFVAASPAWIPQMLVAVPAGLLWGADLRRRSRIKRGGCVGCGYDRSGLSPGAACPECGGAPTPALN